MQTPLKTQQDHLEACPPFVVYYCAGFNLPKRPTIFDIEAASGLSYRTIVRMSKLTTWRNTRYGYIEPFCRACGVDPLNPDAALEWLAKQMELPEPFQDWKGKNGNKALRNIGTRTIMRNRFNRLAARHEMEKLA